ncbi:calmin isoform X2 [Oryzias melastigma]|uniref:calmin isoform X2 n=1 Tax=Oryzias melastigma TaxID=30732 RepID=UPI000CF7DCBE|nr:calmin isoform X2 [Oryzias melastigma]
MEREAVQKRTFTRWMNLHLQKCDPPIQIQDLFRDIQDGFILMVLLEELSGCKLIHGFKKSSHRIFRLNNIAKVLAFLEERNVKLVSIDATDVADGNSSIILGLIWNIILFFQIKELTGNIRSQFPSCSSLSSIPTSSDSDTSHSSTPSEERRNASNALKENSKAIKKLLQWIQRKTRKYGVAVQDFGRSWTSGLAFLALIKSIDSSLVDMRKALLRSPRENLEDAFRIAHYSLGIPRLLEPEDVGFNEPDEQSIIMYVSQFLEHFPGLEEAEESAHLIERSVSMGRLNDSDLMRNGAHLGRVKERTSLFQRDGGKPPPKILLSSVSEDRGVLSPRLRVAATRSWSSDDILSDPPCDVVSHEAQRVADVQQDLSCTSPSFTPDSGNPEPLIPDSAIHSPDSWVESELMPESHSDSSLFDSGPGWDVYRATPVQVLPMDEGFMSPMEDRAPDEPSVTGSYSDEGVSSMESTQDKGQQLNSENPVLELITDPGHSDTSKEVESNHISPLHQEPSWTLNEEVTLLQDDQTNHFQPDFSTEHEESSQREQEGDTTNLNEQIDGPSEEPESITSEEEYPKAVSSLEDEGMDSKNEPHNVSNEEQKTQEEELLAEEICSSETILPNQEETSKTGLIIPIISISSESKDHEEESEQEDWETGENLDKKTESGNGGDDTEPNSPTSPVPLEQGLLESVCSEDLKEEPEERPSSLIPESSDTRPLQQPTEDEQGRSSVTESVQNQEVDEPRQEDSSDDPPVVKESASPVNLDSDAIPAGPASDSGSEVPYLSIMDTDAFELTEPTVPPSSGPSGFNRTTDLFYSQFEENSPAEHPVAAPVEPMDLFYPDKEEPMLSEPADTEMQRWPSVLSVSALEPAPTSADDMDDQLMIGEEDDDELIPSNQERPDALSTQEQYEVPVWESRADIPADIRNSERRDAGSSSGTDEIQIPSGLRRRKGPHLVESRGENQRAALRTAKREDSWWKENSDLYLLLLLWLLLYCLLLLPQMDLQELPSLLLNSH